MFAELKRQGRSSMTIAVDANARIRDGDREFAVASGDFTFVALDENDRPRELNPSHTERGGAG